MVMPWLNLASVLSLKVRMYSRSLAIIGGFLVLASGAGEVYRQKHRTRSLQSTGQVFIGVYLICMVSVASCHVTVLGDCVQGRAS